MRKRTFVAAILGVVLAGALVSCTMEVREREKYLPIVVPYITEQPESASYYLRAGFQADPLKVLVDDWDPEDGELSYQWYTFDTLDEFCDTGGTRIEDATEPELDTGITLVSIGGASAVPQLTGLKKYFYVEVTNTNPGASDRSRASTKSEIVIISINRQTEPAYPIIWNHPAGASQQYGTPIRAMKTVAELPKDRPNGFLTYQWYSNDKFGIEGGTPIEGATYNSYLPDLDTLKLGRNYFYAVVTNTVGSSLLKETTIPATIELRPGIRAEAPRITQQPQDRLYFSTDTVQPLTVTGVSPDGGQISYQWFSNTSAVTTGGEQINGATGSSYTPTITSGTAHYFVRVRNTNNSVSSSQKTADINSKPVTISRVTPAGAGQAFNATITVDPAIKYNYVRGYGGMDVAWANFPNTRAQDTEAMYSPDGLGFNILRIMILPWNVNIDKTMAEVTSSHRPDYYENVKIVNKYGGYVLASPWSPPKEWKSNNSINGGGHLLPAYYKQYASYLKSFAQHMYNKGAPIYVISISNEPNYPAGYDGCEWSNAQMRDFFKQQGHFTSGVRGYGGGKETPVVLTMNGESANTPTINIDALDDPVSRAFIDLLARHNYGEQDVALSMAQRYGKEMWMTEHNINSANPTAYPNDWKWNLLWRFMNDVDMTMRVNNENAIVWWASKRFYSYIGDGQAETTNGAVLPRGWGLSHYAKYTIDTTRIDLQITGTDANGDDFVANNTPTRNEFMNNLAVRATAYISEDGNELSFVMWTPTDTNGNNGVNMGTIKINLPFKAGSVKAIISEDGSYHQTKAVSISSDRESAFVTLGAAQVVSLKFTKQ
jgi:O-glycosyl hydrolase